MLEVVGRKGGAKEGVGAAVAVEEVGTVEGAVAVGGREGGCRGKGRNRMRGQGKGRGLWEQRKGQGQW